MYTYQKFTKHTIKIRMIHLGRNQREDTIISLDIKLHVDN